MPPSVDIWFLVVSNSTDGMGPCSFIWMYSAVNLRKKFYGSSVVSVERFRHRPSSAGENNDLELKRPGRPFPRHPPMIAKPNSDNRRGVTHEESTTSRLGLARTVVLGARIEAERIVERPPYKREQRRCPMRRRACDFYDMANRRAPRLWRAMDRRARPATWSTRPAGQALPDTACAPGPSPGRGNGALHARLRGLGGVAGGPLHRLGGL